MKTIFTILTTLFAVSAIAQPAVSGRTSPAADTIIFLPRNSITLTGTANERNPGHPILDTTWTKTSGPAATITNNSNRMTTTVTNMVTGNYVFTLTATDKASSATSTINVHVVSGSLPIQVSNFKVSKDAGGVVLSWRTNMESGISHFVVQKSVAGSNFTDIAVVASKAVNGNSDTSLDYSYEIVGMVVTADMHNLFLAMILLASVGLLNKLNKRNKGLLLGLVCFFLFSCSKSVTTPAATISSQTEYRLKQVDLDGNINYSAVEVL